MCHWAQDTDREELASCDGIHGALQTASPTPISSQPVQGCSHVGPPTCLHDIQPSLGQKCHRTDLAGLENRRPEPRGVSAGNPRGLGACDELPCGA
jgi:hypothetical protein